MHGEALPTLDGEEAGLATKTTQKMIYTMISWDIPGQSMAVLVSDLVVTSVRQPPSI